ncbi:MAG: RHS repeat-associated core domain-containing protein [Mangrovibacterium sp.]
MNPTTNTQNFSFEPSPFGGDGGGSPASGDNYEKLQYYYHPNYLGSASYITNLDGEVVQHVEYVPFGEVFIEERNNTWNTPFLFNGKELDEETGLYYYGARYYNPRVSLWYGVDPLAEKRSNMSPYNYCSWNPIVKIDPNGMDEWELDKKGNITNRIENKKHDSFHIMDNEGNRTVSTRNFDRGTVSAVRKPTINTTNGRRTLTTFEISGDENAKEIFEFLGDNYTRASGKPIEWTHAKIGTEKSGRNIIGTSHDESSTPVGHYLRLTGYTLREVNHNHPSGYNTPSWDQSNGAENSRRGDVPAAKLYKEKFPNVKLNIHTKQHKYSPYDEYGTLDTRILKGQIR